MKIERKPEWLRKKANPGEQGEMRRLLTELKLNTVCQQANCPNISECFSCGQATFLIMGKECTRLCSFCNVDKGVPLPPDPDEPERVADAATRLRLSHLVITSPTRDDLEDGGAECYHKTIMAIRHASPKIGIEVLIPDFRGSVASLEKVLAAAPDILAHNLETVPRLYHIRSGADYLRSLELLRFCAESAPHIRIKSGIMLGMGELRDEVLKVLRDMYAAGCCYVSIGQYLAPSRRHYPVQEYVTPEQFEAYKQEALQIGFSHVESGPYVRSSYHADKYA
ncbi:MAG: lipoyl synthase [Desulfuromonadaceae bacterium]|nr:lipoyl synthase [Desulfuromonadaceae bacterium]MDD2856376.1 lipoyl synthase [Desulfuromonadaceae bacterium]